MSVFKRADIWWYDFTVKGQRHRASTGARTKELALQIEKRAHRDALLGGSYQAITLEEAADLWFAAKANDKNSATTTAHRVKVMLRHLGANTRITDIGPLKVTQALNSRRVETIKKGKNNKDTGALPSNATVNRDTIDSTLRPILRYARQNLEVEMREINWKDLRLDEPREVVRWFTDEELASRQTHLPIWHRPVQLFIQRYGVRLREAFFPLSAIHDDGVTMDIYTRDRKNGPHVVTLIDSDAAEMRARIGRARAANLDTVWFREMKDGSLTPIHWRGFQSAAAASNRKAGITNARPAHDDRHHAGTILLRRTGNLAAVKELLGHEEIASTMRYAHTSRDDLRATLRHVYGTIEETPKNNIKKSIG